jgi:hypothetical protein
VSDAKGRVKLSWTLGGKPGDQSLIGSVQGTDVKGSYIVPAAGAPSHTPAKTTAAKITPSKTSKKRS